MLRKITVIAGLALCVQLAYAAEAGKVIFVAGKAQVADRQAGEGAPVQEGDLLQTGADGFLYIKTLDNGLFILRPNTRARIVSYHVDVKNPANTRVKLDLISGVARSRSGEAVKHARQNFRFNTPVAAIGVRGTDFTVFTDENTSRVAVISGGIVVSGFAGACRPEGTGPCEGATSRELSAAQRGQLLQIQRGSPAPQLLSGAVGDPEQQTPPNAPLGAGPGAGLSPAEPHVDAQKTESLTKANTQRPPESTPPPVVIPPPVTSEIPAPPEDPVVVVPALPESGIVWGRWQRVLGKTAKINLAKEQGRSELLAVNGNYALFRTPGKEYVLPERGTVGFAMYDSEAFIYSDYGANRVTAPATLTNGKLNVDFGSRTFTTSLDLLTRTEKFGLQGQGTLSRDGRMHGDAANSRVGFIELQGLLSNENGGSAAYIFNGRLDNIRTVNGATYWRK